MSGPYSAEYGAIHHEGSPGFLFTVAPTGLAHDVAKSMNAELALLRRVVELETAVSKAATRFREYEAEHRKKATDPAASEIAAFASFAKAERNATLAAELEFLLSTSTSTKPEATS